jgi:cytochrome b subunit of formate dehydrogenase
MARKRRPTTDSGTVILHLVLVVSFLIALFTGLRIAADDPIAPWLAVLDPVLPVENLWFRHLLAALCLTATLTGYVVYMIRARLTARVRLDAPRLAGLRRRGHTRYAALHALAFWGLMLSLLAEIVTGTGLFFGGGAPLLAVHFWATWGCVACVTLHVLLQMAMGGLGQLSRIFRPAPLVVAPPPPDLAELLAEQLSRNANAKQSRHNKVSAHPLASAAGAIFAVSVLAVGAEQTTRPELHVSLISPAEAPLLDGESSDPIWTKAKPVAVQTTQGGDFGGSGQSLVEIRAVHDGEFIYFAFTWDDPTRSLKHLPLVKATDGWHVAQTDHDKGDERRFHEDKFAVLFTQPSLPLIGAAIHLAASPSAKGPSSSTGRGLHYTQGPIADVWQWRASHQGLNGYIDNCHFGALAEPTQEQIEGRARYSGGFAIDPGPAAYRANVVPNTSKSSADAVTPLRLPRDIAATARALGRVSDTSFQSESEGARWWMSDTDTVPYSAAADAALPVGTVVPGIIMHDAKPADRTAVRGAARWASGRWTLEVARRLYTGSAYDIPMKSGVLMWVAAFDHSETRHTRHLRPFRLEIE